jgi:hypothetical protein
MATSRPFAYNNTGSPISGTTEYDDLVVGNIQANYAANYGGVRWWGGPDEDLRYVIGNARPGGQPVPSGVTGTAQVGFWGTPLGDKTDTSFLNLANYIGAKNGQPTFTTTNQAVTWLNANGYWTSYISPILYLDAGNLESYPTTGTTWTDLNGGKVFNLINGVGYDSGNGGKLYFNASAAQSAQCPTSLPSLSTWSVGVWHYYTGANVGGSPCIVTETFTGGDINYSLGDNTPTSLEYRFSSGFYQNNGWYTTSPSYALTPNNWYYIVGTYDGNTNKLYVNNTLVATGNYAGTPMSSNAGIRLMERWDNANYWDGYLSTVEIYNSALTQLQITTNWDNTKSRFGYGPIVTPTNTSTPTPTLTQTPTSTITPTPSVTNTQTPSVTPTLTQTPTPSTIVNCDSFTFNSINANTTTTSAIKTSGGGWDASAYSVEVYTNPVTLTFQTSNNGNYLMGGFSYNPTGNTETYTNISYGIYLQLNFIEIYENGGQVTVPGETTTLSTDVWKVEYNGTNVTYYKNDVLIYTSSNPVTQPLHIFFPLLTENEGATNICFTEQPAVTPTPTVTQTSTPTPSVTNTQTPSVSPTNTETPTLTPTPSTTPIPVTGYGYNLIALPYNFPSSGNSILNAATGQTGTTLINQLATTGRGFYFNSIDDIGTNRTSYFSQFTGQSVTITFTQNGDSAIYSGDSQSFKFWSGNTGDPVSPIPGTGFVFGTSINLPQSSGGTAVLIQSATTTWVTGATVYVSVVNNNPSVTPTPTATSVTPTPTPTSGATPSGLSVTIVESGGNLVMSASGSLNINDLTLVSPSVGPLGVGGLGVTTATFLMGANVAAAQYSGFTTSPSNFGPGGGGVSPTSTSGNIFGVVKFDGPSGTPSLLVPTGYTTGTVISSTQTFNGQTFSSFGLTPGTYTYTWGSGANADSINVVVS